MAFFAEASGDAYYLCRPGIDDRPSMEGYLSPHSAAERPVIHLSATTTIAGPWLIATCAREPPYRSGPAKDADARRCVLGQGTDGKESNWVPTSPTGEFEVLFRFYGPEKSLFEKKWKLPDIEKVG
jgi:hypothetical protein